MLRAEEGFSSSYVHLPTVPLPIPRRVLRRCTFRVFTPSMAFAVTHPARLPLVPLRGAITRRQDSLRCCGPVGCSHHVAFDVGLRRRAFPPDAANLLPGSLTTTRTGLSPAGGRKLADTRDHATRHTSSPCSDRACPLDTLWSWQRA